MTRTSLIQRLATIGLMAAVGVVSTSCGEVSRTGRSPAFVIVDSIEAAPLAGEQFSTLLMSDVLTNGGTINDAGRATFRLALRNPGTPTAPLGPTTLNEVTLSRYRVRFIRADGRNTPGVDVPWGFDGALTVTIPANGTVQAVFDLVRHVNKEEPPLRNLANLGGASLISTIAEVTFFGRDQAGNDVSAFGNITVNFGDFADPQ